MKTELVHSIAQIKLKLHQKNKTTNPFTRCGTPIHAERQRWSSIVPVLRRTSSLHRIPSSKSRIGSLCLQFEDHNIIIRVQRRELEFWCEVKVRESLRTRVRAIGSDKMEYLPSWVRRRGAR